jgi:subtilisin family serine protease
MTSVRRAWKGVVVAVVAVTLGLPVEPGGPAPAGAVPEQAPERPGPAGPADVLPPGEQWTVTLLTGERVGVRSDDEGRVTVRLQNPEGMVSTLQEPDGDIYVLPSRAAGLLDGRLDRELFNVVGLVRQGYDDAASATLPVILQHLPDAGRTARSAAAEGEAPQPLPSIDAVAVDVSRAEPAAGRQLLDQLADAPEGARGAPPRIWLDRKIETTGSAAPPAVAEAAQPAGDDLDANLAQIGADRAWEAGLDGEGVQVAVLDTGIDATHPDLAGQIVEQENFSDSAGMADRYGHGTHVAATIAGSGAGAPSRRKGVAPEADLLVGKVLGDDGSGATSDVITGMEWAAPRADVINMSLGSSFPSDGSDPFSQALDTLSDDNDTLFVVSAGNAGPTSQTVGVPGASDRALTVGAVDADDRLADFSSRGPLVDSDELKPEIAAPGVDVVAARAANTLMGDPQDALYTAASGTSMASPHVAGAAAVLAERHPDWSAGQLKNGLVGSADDIDVDGFDAGGRLDIGAGVTTTLRPDQDVVDLLVPHPRNGVVEQELAWTNTGDTPLTVDLTAGLADRDGDPVEADAVTVTPSQLTIAPGASGTATLGIDGEALHDGLFSGAVVAGVDGEPVARTPVGLRAQPRLVDLTIEATAPGETNADDTPEFFAWITNLDDYTTYNGYDFFDGSASLQVPAGRYAVMGWVSNDDWDDQVQAVAGDGDVMVDDDTTVVFDGAAAVPFSGRVSGVDEPLVPATSSVGLTSLPAEGSGGLGVEATFESYDATAPLWMVPVAGDPEVFEALQVFRLQKPALTVAVEGDEPLPAVSIVRSPVQPEEGSVTLEAVDAGDGSDLSGVDGKLAVLRLPEMADRAPLTERALEAGAAAVMFVDETRTRPLPVLDPFCFCDWAPLPILAAGGSSATALIAAGQAGTPVTITVAGSDVVYDVQHTDLAELDPTPEIGARERRSLARIDERFHRDPDGTGPDYDSRNAFVETVGYLMPNGPLPARRTSFVSPGVVWQARAEGPALVELSPDWPPFEGATTLSMDRGRTYEAGSRQSVTWGRRPQWPGLIDETYEDYFCPAAPSIRTSDTFFVHVVPLQDALGRVTCGDALNETMTLTQDGQPAGDPATYNGATFPVEPGTSDFVLTYEQDAQAPYEHHSATRWSFRSGEPEGGDALLPLLTVGYRLPLDLSNEPTGNTATLTARHMVDGNDVRIRTMKVWTSTDHGATWTAARVTRQSGRRFDVRLPQVADGTPVSLKIDATDRHGSRIEQTLVDAYTG